MDFLVLIDTIYFYRFLGNRWIHDSLILLYVVADLDSSMLCFCLSKVAFMIQQNETKI